MVPSMQILIVNQPANLNHKDKSMNVLNCFSNYCLKLDIFYFLTEKQMDFVCSSFILKFNVESVHRQIYLEDFQVCIECLWYFSLKRENKHSEYMKVTNHI